MVLNRALALSSLVLCGTLPLTAETVAGLPLHLKRLNPTTVRVWLGDANSSTATVAFATAQGIVVVDTLGIPAIDRELRKVIARELGRSDFTHLINTHEHSDHTKGNPVYADCTIVAHECCAEGMKANTADAPRMLDWYHTRIPELEAELAKKGADSPEGRKLKEELILARLNREIHASAPQNAFPTKTFGDQMTLNLGDTTFELYYVGGMHSASDIAILVPKHGLLLTGDTMADVWLTDTPGCLASFTIRPGVRRDIPLLLKNWGAILARKDQIKELIPGHWNGTLSMKGFEARCAYIRTLWEGINQSVKEGKPVESIFRDFALRARFPELVGSPGITPQNHSGTLTGIWSEITGTESAARHVLEAFAAGNGDKAIQEVLASRNQKPAKYFYLEGEFIYTGYSLLQQNQAQRAIALFKAGTELFPGSWNAFDSLAEAHLAVGDTAQAIANYEKSLQLNPDSKSGKEALARLKGGSR